ncbi:hypothetical protein BRADI_3g47021v3 [Brachypodium distachyon]|uniref:FAR1 domain-containing protein n=1 Tax=Brachypodium distachyon TaxID=15368 RepID=A0A2K2D3Q9_BRADI|nr:hypothetical protein BRADI_3g47021v3 [Brachypodium distachyon]
MDLNLPPEGFDEEEGEVWMHANQVTMAGTCTAQPSEPIMHEVQFNMKGYATATATDNAQPSGPILHEVELNMKAVATAQPSDASLHEVEKNIATAATAHPSGPSLDADGPSHRSNNTISMPETNSWKTNSSNEPSSDDEYAKHVGFSIKCITSRKSALDNEKDKYLFVCNKNDRNNKKIKEAPLVKKKTRSRTKRTDCKVRLRVKRMEAHTHELIKKFSLKKFLRSHGNISKEERDFIKLLHGVNLSSGKIMHFMSEIYGSRKNVPYNTKDVSNLKATFNELEHVGDMGQLLNHFDEMKKEDPAFFYKLNLDHHHRVEKCFVPAYFKDHFFPFLQTTARIEGFNVVLKKYVNPHNSIFQFFLQYKKLQESIEVAEDEQEFEGEDKILRPWSDYPMEEQALAVYTRPIYLDGMLCCHVYNVLTNMGLTDEIPGKLSRKDMRLIRYGNLCQGFTKIAANASTSDKITAIAKKHMATMELDVNAARKAAATASKKKKETQNSAPTINQFLTLRRMTGCNTVKVQHPTHVVLQN